MKSKAFYEWSHQLYWVFNHLSALNTANRFKKFCIPLFFFLTYQQLLKRAVSFNLQNQSAALLSRLETVCISSLVAQEPCTELAGLYMIILHWKNAILLYNNDQCDPTQDQNCVPDNQNLCALLLQISSTRALSLTVIQKQLVKYNFKENKSQWTGNPLWKKKINSLSKEQTFLWTPKAKQTITLYECKSEEEHCIF